MFTGSLKSEFDDFVRFATHTIECGNSSETLESLLRKWRADSEFTQSVADIQQGLADKKAGLGEPMAKVFAEIRDQLGLQ